MQTEDGFLLGLHRLAWKQGEEDAKVNSGPNSLKKRVVYLHHGLLMNSEVWVCLTDAQRALPFLLVEKGFDVWVGNNPNPIVSTEKGDRSRVLTTTTASWATIVGISTPRSRYTIRRPL